MLTLLITFLQKKHQHPLKFVKVIARQRWDVFETQCT